MFCRFCRRFYYVPRIDQEIIQQYKDDVIVTTGGIYGQIPQMILNEGESNGGGIFMVEKSV